MIANVPFYQVRKAIKNSLKHSKSEVSNQRSLNSVHKLIEKGSIYGLTGTAGAAGIMHAKATVYMYEEWETGDEEFDKWRKGRIKYEEMEATDEMRYNDCITNLERVWDFGKVKIKEHPKYNDHSFEKMIHDYCYTAHMEKHDDKATKH